MSKNILILQSSPRIGGNSDILCDEFIKGAKEADHSCEKIYLTKKDIKLCTGCLTCDETHSCVIDDDMREILEKMVNADVIVMATPVYFFTMSGQMKMLIDRTTPRFSEIKDKEFYFIFTAATPNEKHLVNVKREFKSYLNCLTNPTNKGTIYGLGVGKVGDIKEKKETLLEAYKYGKNA